MISGQRGPSPPRNRFSRTAGRVGAILVALWGSMTSPADAQSHGLRLVLVQPENAELITRVEGQTRDLGVTLQVAPSGWSRGTAEQAAAIAAANDADFVARLQRSAGGVLELRVYAARARTLRTRRVPHARSERLGTSAELEAAALVLRGELTELIEADREAEQEPSAPPGNTGLATPPVAAGEPARTGGSPQRQTGEPSTAVKPKPSEEVTTRVREEPDEEPEAEPDEEEEEEEEEVDEPSAPLENYTAGRSPWTLRGGVQGSIPIDSHLAGSLLLGARAPVAFVEVGVALTTALPFEITDPTAGFTLWRSSLVAEALAAIPVGPRLRALLGVEAGVVLYARSTDDVDPRFTAAGSELHWAATLGAHAELQWLLARQFGVALGFGLAYSPQRTRFAYREDATSQPHEIAALRSLEPHASLSLFGLFGE
jgi:hypothetical protein